VDFDNAKSAAGSKEYVKLVCGFLLMRGKILWSLSFNLSNAHFRSEADELQTCTELE